MGVAGPVWVSRSFCSFLSIASSASLGALRSAVPTGPARAPGRSVDLAGIIGYQPARLVLACGTAFRNSASVLYRTPSRVNKERLPMEAGQKRIELCSSADVAVGTALKVETEGLAVAVFNLDG